MAGIDMGELIRAQLRELGADGLVNPELECGCSINDLWPCGGPDVGVCQAGQRLSTPHAHESSDYDDFYVPFQRKGNGDG